MPTPETPFEPTALVDTLRFRLVSAVVVPRLDVRVSVTVTALVSSTDTDRAALEQRVRETLDRFPAQWTGAVDRAREGRDRLRARDAQHHRARAARRGPQPR